MDGQQSIMLSFHLAVIHARRASVLLSCHLSCNHDFRPASGQDIIHESRLSIFHGESQPKHRLGEMSDNIHFAFLLSRLADFLDVRSANSPRKVPIRDAFMSPVYGSFDRHFGVLLCQSFFVEPERELASGFFVWNATTGDSQLDIGRERAAMEQVVEYVVAFVGHWAFSKIMHTSCSPGMNDER